MKLTKSCNILSLFEIMEDFYERTSQELTHKFYEVKSSAFKLLSCSITHSVQV